MEKRIFIAVLISIAVVWIWADIVAPRIFPELTRRPQPAATSTQTTTTTATSAPAPAATTTTATGEVAAPPSIVPAAAIAPISAAAQQITTIDGPEFTARFSNRGAQLVSFQLKNYKTDDGKPVELVKARDPNDRFYPFAVQTQNATITRNLNTAFYQLSERSEKGARVLEYRYAGGGVSATKTFRIGNEFLFDFSVQLAPAMPYRVVIGPGIRTLAPDEKDTQIIITGNGVYQANGELEIVQREDSDQVTEFQSVQFIGIEDNYFLAAIKPAVAGTALFHRTELTVPGAKEKRPELYAGVNANGAGTVSGSSFFGPKQTQILERYGLEAAMQFGWFGFIARLLLEVLLWINNFTKNYGFAIIVLTVIIKIVLYPLQHKSIVSMKKMQKLQPKMEAIKAKYKKSRTDPEQRQKMNTEVMKLYQQEGINPMGGCLPILLQLPILWGFYGLLSRAIELRGAPFILWINDLAEKDPYYITPILMTATMFIQQAITPTTADPVQKRMFMMMPLIFGFIFKDFPSGLVLYWLVQNVLTIIQQLIMNKYWKDHPDELQTA